MQETTGEAFIDLFKESVKKCFGTDLHSTLSETECKHFSNEILDKTGLVIGAKSLKNYSAYVLHPEGAKPEKPSVATLDTLARYILNAPYTDEIKRKEKEAHYPYWFQYRNNMTATKPITTDAAEPTTKRANILAGTTKKAIIFTGVIITTILLLAAHFFIPEKSYFFQDNFRNTDNDSLTANGWFLQSEDKAWWNKRGETPSCLTLYTLTGDNWADSSHAPVIKNLLVRRLTSNCFTAEIHLDSFVPMHRWQQAGILLLEDTNLFTKSLRMSIAYNDFFGGYSKPKEIIVQAIHSSGNNASNPEEIIHLPLFSVESGQESLVANNLNKSALRIEKTGNHYRFLYATGQAGNFAFKEALNKDLPFQPKYIALFALGGFVEQVNYLPVRFSHFNLVTNPRTE